MEDNRQTEVGLRALASARGVGRVCLAALAVLALAAVAGQGTDGPTPLCWRGDTLIYESGEWELHVRYLDKGTRSEGQDGTLYRDGREVEPAGPAASLQTPLGELKHYGTQRARHWDTTGWNFADRALLKPSASLSASLEPGKAGQPGVLLEVRLGQDGGTRCVDMKKGQHLVVALAGNPAIGQTWELSKRAADSFVLEQKGGHVFRPADPLMAGGGGQIEFTFVGKAPGEVTLRFRCDARWAREPAATVRARIHVAVRE